MIRQTATRWRTAVKDYVGLDVSLSENSICIVDEKPKIVKEGRVGSEPETIAVQADASAGGDEDVAIVERIVALWQAVVAAR